MVRIAILCPDTNVELSHDALQKNAVRGGKAAILHLAWAWVRAGHEVVLFGGRVKPGNAGRFSVWSLDQCGGEYDVAIYVTGSLAHFRVKEFRKIQSKVNIFWINGPGYAEEPQVPHLDWIVAPSQFLARRAVDEWGLPPERIVVIRGEAVRERVELVSDRITRDPYRGFFASHPDKGLSPIVRTLEVIRKKGFPVTLDLFGSEKLWGLPEGSLSRFPSWVQPLKDIPQDQINTKLKGYGFMPYFVEWEDGFSLATAEAMAEGVLVFASGHGSNAELIRHGWNGYLVTVRKGKPDYDQAERLLLAYMKNPEPYERVRIHAQQSIPTWDEQAVQWSELWS